MVNAFYSRGARCVIGFQRVIETKASTTFAKSFCQAIGNGYTVNAALAYADVRVAAECEDDGYTDSRLTRGDTSISLKENTSLLRMLDVDEESTDDKKVYFTNKMAFMVSLMNLK